jgi:hypothetical protein
MTLFYFVATISLNFTLNKGQITEVYKKSLFDGWSKRNVHVVVRIKSREGDIPAPAGVRSHSLSSPSAADSTSFGRRRTQE